MRPENPSSLSPWTVCCVDLHHISKGGRFLSDIFTPLLTARSTKGVKNGLLEYIRPEGIKVRVTPRPKAFLHRRSWSHLSFAFLGVNTAHYWLRITRCISDLPWRGAAGYDAVHCWAPIYMRSWWIAWCSKSPDPRSGPRRFFSVALGKKPQGGIKYFCSFSTLQNNFQSPYSSTRICISDHRMLTRREPKRKEKTFRNSDQNCLMQIYLVLLEDVDLLMLQCEIISNWQHGQLLNSPLNYWFVFLFFFFVCLLIMAIQQEYLVLMLT